MKNIAVLIDFTEGSAVALKQAISLSKLTNATVTALNIASAPEKVKHAEEELATFIQKYDGDNSVKKQVVVGNLIQATENALANINPDLVLICTHGVKGMYQYLFGSQILKMVQTIPYPCLVVHENKGVDLAMAKSILMPIGPHPDFMLKVKQTANYAKAVGANIVIYRIDRPGNDFQNLLIKNEEASKQYLSEQQVPFTTVLQDLEVVSVGYSRQTINFVVKHNISVISLMANVSQNDQLFGYGDKENYLVNSEGISILTCN